MADAASLNRYYYGEIKLPPMLSVERHFGKRSIWLGFRFATNFWQLRAHIYSKFIGGFQFDLCAPTWIQGWANYGMLNRLIVFGPKPRMDVDDCFPQLFKIERWTDIVTDKELCAIERS